MSLRVDRRVVGRGKGRLWGVIAGAAECCGLTAGQGANEGRAERQHRDATKSCLPSADLRLIT